MCRSSGCAWTMYLKAVGIAVEHASKNKQNNKIARENKTKPQCRTRSKLKNNSNLNILIEKKE